MSRIRWGGSTVGKLAAGFVLMSLATLPLTGCSHSAASSPDEATASAFSGSSMTVQGAVLPGSTTDAAAASAVPQPIVPPVTSPTTPALAIAAPINPSPVAPSIPAAASPSGAVVASTDTSVLKGLGGSGMQSSASTLNPAMMRALKQFQVASATFPDFCRDWARKLSVREHDNLQQIKWAIHNGVETGNYVGYGAIESCTCKEASNGVAVGVLTYKEFNYSLTGKDLQEARHATPHATAVVPTREIFAYEKGKWFW